MDKILNIEQLEDLLSQPTDGVLTTFEKLNGDIIILGVGGKMGPTLAKMAKRADEKLGKNRRIIGVSRFSNEKQIENLNKAGIETIKADLLDMTSVADLPSAPNVVFMAGQKFGTSNQESLTWAMNSYLPGLVANKYKNSKIIVFSTGNIYGLTPLTHGGSKENSTPNPEGEYAMSVLGRERIFEHFSKTCGTKIATIRLNYAVEMRYGVLADIAGKVWKTQPVDLEMGNVNVIWQGSANAMILQSFDCVDAPPFIINIAGPELLSVRQIAERFGELMNKKPVFIGEERDNALMSNSAKAVDLFGYPSISPEQVIRWIAHWVMEDKESLNKPTHFEARDGRF